MHSFCDLQSFGKELPEFLLCDSEKAFRPLQCRETGRYERSCADYVVNMYICIYIYVITNIPILYCYSVSCVVIYRSASMISRHSTGALKSE